MDASTCIYMYCKIERNIMKNQSGSPRFGIQEKISMYLCFTFYALAIVYFLFFKNPFTGHFCTGLKLTSMSIQENLITTLNFYVFLFSCLSN